MPIVAREQLAGALNVRTREPREFRPDEVELLEAIASQVAQSIVHAKLYADAQRRVAELEALARISEAVSESLYLEESLEAIVKTTMDAVQATGAALVLEDGRIAWPEGRAGARRPHAAPLEAPRDRRARRRPRHAVHRRGARAARGDRAPRRRRARARARGDARRARARDPPPRQEQPPDRRLAPAPAGERGGSRSARGARALRQPDPRHRRGARGAHRAARGGRRARGADRPAARDARAGDRCRPRRRGTARAGLARRQPRDRARARLPRAAPERARARRRHGSRSSSRAANGDVVLAIADEGAGADGAPSGTGLSIVRALVADELQGSFAFTGARAEVVFPA